MIVTIVPLLFLTNALPCYFLLLMQVHGVAMGENIDGDASIGETSLYARNDKKDDRANFVENTRNI
jgi:hypothetical protein